MSVPANVIRTPRKEKSQTDEMAAKLSDGSAVTSKVSRSEGQTPEVPMKDARMVRRPIGTQPARRTQSARTKIRPAGRDVSVSSAPSVAEITDAPTMIFMAGVVLRNAGRPLAAQAVPEKIRRTFGVVAARGLPRLLTKRARSSRSGFYLTADNLIGLIDKAPVGSMPRP
jgi:hypothetical protein